MSTSERDKLARHYARAIRANVDDFYADTITYEEFGKRQAELWREARNASLTVAFLVARLLDPKGEAAL